MERKNTLKRCYYSISQVAKEASVTVRTLRYYDCVGLLSPSHYTESGYRLYTEEDMLTLQHILALKFLGFSLQEIKCCLESGPKQLEKVLAQQREMMLAKRKQLDAIIKTIRQTEALLEAGQCGWESIVRVVEVIQMEQKTEWVKKYLSDEQLEKMQALGQSSYSEEARQKLASRGEWTEADQQKASADWAYVGTEAQRLAAAGADPAGEEAQALAKFKSDLLFAFTQGDPDIESGLRNFWQSYQAMPEEEKPLESIVPASALPSATDPGAQLLEQAMTTYQERQRA